VLDVMHPPRRILVIRPSALGDVCRSVPIAVSVKRAFPDAELAWVVQDAFADALVHHPDIDRIIPFPRAKLGRDLRRGRFFPTLEWAMQIRDWKPSLAIDAQGLLRSGLISFASGAPRRLAYADAAEGSAIFATERAHAPRHLHTVDRMLALVAHASSDPVADLSLHADPAELQGVDRDYPKRGPVVLAPTSRWAAKRWPAWKWADLARRLLARGHGPIAVVGGPGERHQCEPLITLAIADDRVDDWVGATSVARMMAIIARARLVVANDSAAAHMAVGFHRPLVALFGPTRTELVGPYHRDRDVIQHASPADDMNHKRHP
jgi:heptosyltransferase-1